MKSNAFYDAAAQLDYWDKQVRAATEGFKDAFGALKECGDCSKEEAWAVKRIIKALNKGDDAVNDLRRKSEAQDKLLDDLSGKLFSGNQISHDPDTGEIIESGRVANLPEMAPDADPHGLSSPSDAPEVRDTGVTDDNPCPPIPESMRRYA